VRVRNSTKPARAYATDCPQLAKADMGVLTSGSGPLRTWGVQCNRLQVAEWPANPLTDLREIGIMGAILPRLAGTACNPVE
jgi:hypothetical protein